MSVRRVFSSLSKAFRSGALLFSLGAAALVSACSSAPDGELPPAYLSAPEATVASYRVGPLDELQIFVWRNPELSTTLQVRPDGHISMPLIDDLEAAGKTTMQIAEDIEAALANTIRSPEVTVVARNFNGTYDQQIRVLGEAVNPSALQFQSNMTVMDVMIRVGGLTEFADGNRARLVRFESGAKKQYRLRLSDLVEEGDIDANVRLKPGDVIVIPGTLF